jgi:adenylate kinase
MIDSNFLTSDSVRAILSGKLLFPFIAPPNAGKGTQTQILANHYPLATFDMGSTFRAIMKEGADPLAKAELEQFINAGRLVPIATVAKVFKQHFEALALRSPQVKGFILDGFPRSAEQARVLESLCEDWGAEIGAVIYLAVSNETVEQRATGRRFCSLNPLHVYNLSNPKLAPQTRKLDVLDQKGREIWLCDHDQAELIVRPDDQPEKVSVRLEEYVKGTEPLLTYFRHKNLLIEINGEQTPSQVTQELQVHLDPVLKSQTTPAILARSD